MATAWTLLGNGFVGRSELALRVIGTTIKSIALPRALFYQITISAERALYPDEVLLHILALGITAAGSKLPITAVPDHHVPSALGADFVERNVRNLLALIQTAGGLAVGISGARHELPEAAALQHHHPPAVLAIFFLRGLLHVGGIEIRQINGILFGERTTVGIFLVVRTARIEGTVLAPLDHQR